MGLNCPDKGILVRLCFAYVSADAGTMPLMSGCPPSLLKADRFAEWLALPEEEKEISYWADDNKIRYKIWTFVIWLVNRLKVFDDPM